AVRAALGASRRRLVRKALVESVVIGIMGGVPGIAVAYAGAGLILHLAYASSGQAPWIPVQASPTLSVLLFARGISIVTGVLFGVAPAWITSRAEPIEAMRGGHRVIGGRRHWVQKTLVIVQMAMSLVLLSAAAMLGQSLRNHE